jgi:hypothetical protein
LWCRAEQLKAKWQGGGTFAVGQETEVSDAYEAFGEQMQQEAAQELIERKFQVVWKVEGMTIEEAESLNRAMVREFDGDPAATDSTRVLRLPGFANKKYQPDFFVQARAESTQTYHLRDFKLQIDSQDAPRHHHEGVGRKESASSGALSQSEQDWAFALRALSRGDDPEEVIRRIADYRAADKHDPEYYARFTVQKARAEIQSRSAGANDAGGQPTQEIEISRDPIEMP